MFLDTFHKVYNSSLINYSKYLSDSIALIVTSPPYPMVTMWDECFKEQNKDIENYIDKKDYFNAWKSMHEVLNDVWKECIRILRPGGIICINIGDATRTFDGLFQMFSNRTIITDFFIHNGCVALPEIIWRKRTNAPNKFMGSGMYAPGAYVTLEHESILIFRKGSKREFVDDDKENRRKSAYFYNERNIWFSDLWEFQGVSQKGVKGSRDRNASFPIELPYRLINMFSVLENDIVIDPFGGLGTTMMAAIMAGRNSISFDIDPVLCEYMKQRVFEETNWNRFREERLLNQNKSIELEKEKGKKLYFNSNLNIEVKTKQEQEIYLPFVDMVQMVEDKIVVVYK